MKVKIKRKRSLRNNSNNDFLYTLFLSYHNYLYICILGKVYNEIKLKEIEKRLDFILFCLLY